MRRPQFTTFLKIAFSLALMVYLFSQINILDLLDRYRSINLAWIVLCLFFLLFQTLFSSFKWKTILKSDQIDLPVGYLWRTYLISNFFSLFLPSSIGGDFYRIYTVQSASQNLSKSTTSVVFDRMTGLFALLSIAFVSSLFLPGNQYLVLTSGLYLAAILGFLVMSSDYVNQKLSATRFRGSQLILKLQTSFNKYRKNTSSLLLVLLISIFFQFNIVLSNKFYVLSLGIDVPFSQLLIIIPLIHLIEAIPVSINGFGVREGAYVFFFTLIGRTKEEGLAVSLLMVLLRYVLGSLGGLLWLTRSEKTQSVLQEPGGNSSS